MPQHDPFYQNLCYNKAYNKGSLYNVKFVNFLENIHLLYIWIAPESTKNCIGLGEQNF